MILMRILIYVASVVDDRFSKQQEIFSMFRLERLYLRKTNGE